MGMKFNADEIFEMAEKIEKNGAAFYRAAANRVADDEIARQVLRDLAEMEDEHLKTFSAMRKELARNEKAFQSFDPSGEAALYLDAFADGHVFELDGDPAGFLAGAKTIRNIFEKAMGLEKDSIVFYLGMKEMVPENLGGKKIDGIIKEEMRHVTLLGKKMSEL